MADQKIIITTPGGVLHYEQIKDGVSQGDGKHARVKQNDAIRWHCDAGDYAILLKRDALSNGALRANVLSANATRDTQPPAKVTKAHDPNPGADNTYRYFVVVMAGGVPITEDPDIIIDA